MPNCVAYMPGTLGNLCPGKLISFMALCRSDQGIFVRNQETPGGPRTANSGGCLTQCGMAKSTDQADSSDVTGLRTPRGHHSEFVDDMPHCRPQ